MDGPPSPPTPRGGGSTPMIDDVRMSETRVPRDRTQARTRGSYRASSLHLHLMSSRFTPQYIHALLRSPFESWLRPCLSEGMIAPFGAAVEGATGDPAGRRGGVLRYAHVRKFQVCPC